MALISLAATPFDEARAGGIGGDISSSRREQFYPDSETNSFRTAIVRSKNQLYWEELEWKQIKARFFLEEESWGFEGPTGENLIDLKFTKVNPRFTFIQGPLKAETSVLFMEVSRAQSDYLPHTEDSRSSFVLPSLRLDYGTGRFFIMSGAWREHDVVPLNGSQYALINDFSVMAGGGMNLPHKQRIHLEYVSTKRNYPAQFDSRRGSFSLVYKQDEPFSTLGFKPWRAFSAKFTNSKYIETGTGYNVINLDARFKSKMGNITHFLTYGIMIRDSFSTYTGAVDTLTEEVIDKSDLLHTINYDAFTWLGKGPMIFAWGIKIEDSLIQEAVFEWGLHLRLVFSF